MLGNFLIPRGSYEAQFKGLVNRKSGAGVESMVVQFWIPELEMKVEFYPSRGMHGVRDAMEYILYFLSDGGRISTKPDYEDLVGKWCKLEIKWIGSIGAGFPTLCNVMYSDKRIDSISLLTQTASKVSEHDLAK